MYTAVCSRVWYGNRPVLGHDMLLNGRRAVQSSAVSTVLGGRPYTVFGTVWSPMLESVITGQEKLEILEIVRALQES